MAKKKAKKAAPRRRRSSRKIGGVDTGLMVSLAAAGAGYLAANMIDKFVPIDNPLLKNGIKVGVALFVPTFIKGPNGVAIAMGIGANAISKTVVNFVPALGATDDEVVMIQGINQIGEDYVESLSGINTIGEMKTLSGIEEMIANG